MKFNPGGVAADSKTVAGGTFVLCREKQSTRTHFGLIGREGKYGGIILLSPDGPTASPALHDRNAFADTVFAYRDAVLTIRSGKQGDDLIVGRDPHNHFRAGDVGIHGHTAFLVTGPSGHAPNLFVKIESGEIFDQWPFADDHICLGQNVADSFAR